MASSTTDDWQLDKSVLESNKYVLENQLYCDVTFVFNEENEAKKQEGRSAMIRAHKFMLITRSPVFCAMFTGPAKDESAEIKIEDVDKESFMEMLRYIYSEMATLTGYNVLTVLYCAKKYMISRLEKLCKEYLEKQIDHTNVCFILEQASLMGENDLEEKCLEILDGHADDALKSESFTKVTQSTVVRILKRETLSITEVEVYKACIKWADTECNRQNKKINDENRRFVMGEILRLIRFPTMDQEEFFQTVGTSKVLTAEEAFDIALQMKKLKPHGELVFSHKPRDGVFEDHFFTNAHSCQQDPVREAQTYITANIPNGVIEISSVYFLNRSGEKLSVHLVRNGSVQKLERLHQSHNLYEATFNPPVALKTGNHVIMFTRNGNRFNATAVLGQNCLKFKSATISMDRNAWFHVVGFKLRLR